MKKISFDTEHFLKNKKASFLLACCVTKTCNIDGITQAGIPNHIELTPTLDSEFVSFGGVASLPNIATTPKGVPTPALITRAVHTLKPFCSVEFLDLGFTTIPKVENKIYHFGINASDRIDNNAKIDAKMVFESGRRFGSEYKCDGEYIILAETTPSGTTTAEATARTLGYECDGYFASTFQDAPTIKQQVINKALTLINNDMDIFQKLSILSDNMIIFCSGFLLEASKSKRVVLAGGTQMASVLLTLNSISKYLNEKVNSDNINLFTTKWIYEDRHSNIEALLNQLDFVLDSYYADFDFSLTTHPALKLYDKGEAKEGVGAGASICYAYLQGISQAQITDTVEGFLR